MEWIPNNGREQERNEIVLEKNFSDEIVKISAHNIGWIERALQEIFTISLINNTKMA